MKRNIKITVALATTLLMNSSAIAGVQERSRGRPISAQDSGIQQVLEEYMRDDAVRLMTFFATAVERESLVASGCPAARPTAEGTSLVIADSGVDDSQILRAELARRADRLAVKMDEFETLAAVFISPEQIKRDITPEFAFFREIKASFKLPLAADHELLLKRSQSLDKIEEMLNLDYRFSKLRPLVFGLAAVSVLAPLLGKEWASSLRKELRAMAVAAWDGKARVVDIAKELRRVVRGPIAIEKIEEALVRLVGREIALAVMAEHAVADISRIVTMPADARERSLEEVAACLAVAQRADRLADKLVDFEALAAVFPAPEQVKRGIPPAVSSCKKRLDMVKTKLAYGWLSPPLTVVLDELDGMLEVGLDFDRWLRALRSMGLVAAIISIRVAPLDDDSTSALIKHVTLLAMSFEEQRGRGGMVGLAEELRRSARGPIAIEKIREALVGWFGRKIAKRMLADPEIARMVEHLTMPAGARERSSAEAAADAQMAASLAVKISDLEALAAIDLSPEQITRDITPAVASWKVQLDMAKKGLADGCPLKCSLDVIESGIGSKLSELLSAVLLRAAISVMEVQLMEARGLSESDVSQAMLVKALGDSEASVVDMVDMAKELRQAFGRPIAIEKMKEALVRLVGDGLAERMLADPKVKDVSEILTCSEEKWQALKSQ